MKTPKWIVDLFNEHYQRKTEILARYNETHPEEPATDLHFSYNYFPRDTGRNKYRPFISFTDQNGKGVSAQFIKPSTPIFYYEDGAGYHELTMTRPAVEWCNSDCPEIRMTSNDEYNNWLVNSGGTYIESCPEWVQKRFISFFLASSRAFYRKYPQCKNDPRNGFWANFLHDNTGYLDLIKATVGNVTPEEAF